MSKDLKISIFDKFAMQLFANVVLQIQTEVEVNDGIVKVIMNAFNGKCARSFCREKLLKKNVFSLVLLTNENNLSYSRAKLLESFPIR